MSKFFIEDSLSTRQGSGNNILNRMQKKFAGSNVDILKEGSELMKDKSKMKLLVEGAKINIPDVKDGQLHTKLQLMESARINAMQANLGKELLAEAASIQGTATLSPITVNSFGIQERATLGTHLPRAVKQVAALVDNFKLSERTPWIHDIAGKKTKFIEAFDRDAEAIKIKDIRKYTAEINAFDVDLYAAVSEDTNKIFGFDSYPTAFNVVEADGVTAVDVKDITLTHDSSTGIAVESGDFSYKIKWTDSDGEQQIAAISGQFDFKNGKLTRLSCTNNRVKSVEYDLIISPETHHAPLKVGYDIKHTEVHIPIGAHFEYSISEEFKDASEKYHNQDAMLLLTELMSRAVEQVKDISCLRKYQELGKSAIFPGVFTCTPEVGFTHGEEENIRRHFQPYMEKVAIILKNKTRIQNCHFRIIGNPMDIRVADVIGAEYIFKRNQEYFGDIVLDYDFAVASGVHQMFYLSSDRVPQGRAFMFLIPNEIESNISTVNHYEYATYASNKYRSPDSNLPTAMISSRYLTKEYFPVVATIDFPDSNPMTLEDYKKTIEP